MMSRLKKQSSERDNRTNNDALKTTEMLMLLGLCVSANSKVPGSMGPVDVSHLGSRSSNNSPRLFASANSQMNSKQSGSQRQAQPLKDVHSARKQKNR